MRPQAAVALAQELQQVAETGQIRIRHQVHLLGVTLVDDLGHILPAVDPSAHHQGLEAAVLGEQDVRLEAELDNNK